jgi:hypothetical protein
MSPRKKQGWQIAGAAAVCFMLLTPASAHKDPDLGSQGAIGQITSVSFTSITVQRRGFDARTYAITPATTIANDYHPTTADRLALGQFAFVTSADGTSATAINVNVHADERRKAQTAGVIITVAMIGIFAAIVNHENQQFHHDASSLPTP